MSIFGTIGQGLKTAESKVGSAFGSWMRNGYNGQYGPNMNKATMQHIRNNTTAANQAGVAAAGRNMKSYKKGGMVHKTGPAFLHKGEYVVPKSQVDAKHNAWMLSDTGALKLGDHTE